MLTFEFTAEDAEFAELKNYFFSAYSPLSVVKFFQDGSKRIGICPE
jgi:hypothetical protein